DAPSESLLPLVVLRIFAALPHTGHCDETLFWCPQRITATLSGFPPRLLSLPSWPSRNCARALRLC
ncbi:unnamed protein product, partial [Mycena citricolor]